MRGVVTLNEAKRPFFASTLLLVSALLLSACSTSATTPAAQGESRIEVSDIKLTPMAPTTSTERVVALANGSAEILYALGAGDLLVGRDIASTFDGDADVPVVTSAHSISAELVLEQRPTLVIVDARSGPAEAISQIKRAGVRVQSVPDAWTLADMPKKIAAIAALVGLDQQANTLIREQNSALAQLAQSSADMKSGALPSVGAGAGAGASAGAGAGAGVKASAGARVAFLYLRGTSSIYLLGGKGSGADALLSGIGAIDVGAERGLKAFTPLTSESLIQANPQVLLVMSKGLESVGGVDGLVKLPGVAQTNAGRARRVIAVDDSLLLSFGPRTPALMKLLAEAISNQMSKESQTSKTNKASNSKARYKS